MEARHVRDPDLMKKVRRVELLVGRLRARRAYNKSPSGSASNIDPSLSLVDKARMLQYRAVNLNRRVQSDKSDETTYTTDTYTRSGQYMFYDDSSVTWYSNTRSYDNDGSFAEI